MDGRALSHILMVTPYAPWRDGIAAYAVQEVQALRAAGHDVEVLSPEPSAAHHHLDLRSPRGPLALAKRVRAYEYVVVQYHPDVFYPHPITPMQYARVTLGLIACFRLARHLEVRIHEFDDEPARYGHLNAALSRRMWHSADRLIVHTETELARFANAYGRSFRGRLALADHGEHFLRRTSVDRATARRLLGLRPDAHLFVTIGFIQPHKGFDRAVHAFIASGLAAGGAELHVVGSVRVDEPAFLAHRDELAATIEATPGAHLHEGYLSDEAFDLWLVAADTIVLPYRQIWSSGVMERAALYERPVIASRVGGLAEQAPPGTVLVGSDQELVDALRAAAPGLAAAAPLPSPTPAEPWPEGDRDTVQAEIARRAAADQGPRSTSQASP